MNTYDNVTSIATIADKIVVLDLEFLPDEKLYARYVKLDPRPARIRWPFKRVVAATVMTLSVEHGLLQVEHFKTFTGSDEGRLVSLLFAYLNERNSYRLVTWGGLNTDIPVLRIAAMEHGLKLPVQLRPQARDRRGWMHLDLCKEMQAGEYVHLSEVATRLSIPTKFAGCAASIPELIRQGNWCAVGWVCEADVVTLACLVASQLATTSGLISAEAAHHDILSFVRQLRGQAPYNSYLGNVQHRLRARIKAELQRWIARVA